MREQPSPGPSRGSILGSSLVLVAAIPRGLPSTLSILESLLLWSLRIRWSDQAPVRDEVACLVPVALSRSAHSSTVQAHPFYWSQSMTHL